MALITLVGVFLSANKKKRMQVFAELYEFNEQLILNLKFARNPISKVAEPFTYIAEIMNGKCVLDGKDGEFISEYTVNIGKSDPLSQIDYLNGRKQSLTKYREESASDYKRYSSLYVKIFFMIGVLAAVLLA